MKELLRSNNPVFLSFVDALLNEAGIRHQIVDLNMSIVEGSIGVLPRRMLVASDRHAEAEQLIIDAGHASELPGGGVWR